MTPATIAAPDEPRPRPWGIGLCATSRSEGIGTPARREGVRDGAHDEVRLVERHLARADAVHLDVVGRGIRRLDLELVVAGEREAERVEAGAEVRRGRRHLHVHGATDERGDDAWVGGGGRGHEVSPSTWATCAVSTGTTVGCTSEPSAVRSAHCGSFSPWPVTVSTTRAGGHTPGGRALEEAGDADRRRGLDEDADLGREDALRLEDLVVVDGAEVAVGLVARLQGELPRRGVADADRARDGVGIAHRLAAHDRRRARGLEAEHPRHPRGVARRDVLAVAARVRGVVARVADRDEVEVGRVAEHLDDLERRGLLALDAVVVDRVHEVHRVVRGEVARDVEAVVEVALHLQQLGVVRDGLAELAHRDLALGHEHGGRDARVRGVGGRRRRRVARGGADHDLRTALDGLGHGHRHAAVLEGAGGVHALELHPHVGAGAAGERRRGQERRAALAEGDDGRGIRHIQPVGVFADDAAPLARVGLGGGVVHTAPSTRRTDATDATTGLWARAATVSASADSFASCVPMTSVARSAARSRSAGAARPRRRARRRRARSARARPARRPPRA